MKRVLIVADSPYLDTGFSTLGYGIGQYLYDHQFNVEHIGLFDPRHNKETHFNNKHIPWTVHRCGNPNSSQPQYNNVINSFSPDVIIVITDIWLADPFLHTNIPTILYVHIEGEPLPNNIYTNGKIISCPDVLLAANKLVLGGPFARQVIQDRFTKLAKPIDLTTIISDGCRIDKYNSLKNKQLKYQLWKINKNAFVVGYFGRQNPRKGLPYAIEAFAKWNKPNTYLYLHTAIKDSCGWDVPSMVKDYDIQNKVIIDNKLQVGQGVPIEKLNQLYNACDCTVASSSGEGFGGTVCFAKNTYVRTKYGHRPIQWIKPGDYVYTHKGNLKKVLKTYKRMHTGRMYTIYTDISPMPIRVTAKHPFLSRTWKTSDKLERNDVLYYPVIQASEAEENFVVKQLRFNTHYPRLSYRYDDFNIIVKIRDILLSLKVHNQIKQLRGNPTNYQLNIYQNILLKTTKKKIDDTIVKYIKAIVTKKTVILESELVYNLKVEDDHSYIVNGVAAVKNCDSLATETPAIITDYSELKNFKKGTMKVKPAAFYVEPRTNIRRAIPSIPDIIKCFNILYNDRAMIKELGKKGRKDVEKYDWKNIGPQWVKTINSMTPMIPNKKNTKTKDPVSIIILNKDHYDLITNCISHIRKNTKYPYEIIIVDNGSTDSNVIQYLKQIVQNKMVKVYYKPGEFNFSKLCNFGARQSKNSLICFLNSDAFMKPNWLTAMVEQLQQPKVGIVGAKLLFQDGRLQHAGIAIDDQLNCEHTYIGQPSNFSPSCCIREVQALTGACLLTYHNLFNQLGQFDEQYHVENQDADYCLKIKESGHKVIYTPYAIGTHLTCATRGRIGDKRLLDDRTRFKEKWRKKQHILGIKHQPLEPLISIIIPTYNCGEYLPDLIESINNQTYKNYEIIIVDDKSTDNTIDVLSKLTSNNKFAVLKINKHTNANIARMEGFKRANGEYIMFSDADSKWAPNMLEKMAKILQDPKISYAYSDYKREGLINDTFKTVDFKAEYLRISNYISMMSLIRKKDFPGLDITIQRAQDWDLWLTMLENDKIGKHIAEPLFLAYVRKNSITGGESISWEDAVDIVKKKHRKKDISIILTLKNRYSMLHRMFETIDKQNYKNFEVIISDFYSTDIDFNKLQQKFKFPIAIIQNDGKFNRSTGLNNGATIAKYDRLFFTDADMLFPKNFTGDISSNIKEKQTYFPICKNEKDLYNADQLGWRKGGYGNCGIYKTDFERIGKWSGNFQQWGGEDNFMFWKCGTENIKIIRNTVPEFIHQDHNHINIGLRSKEFLENIITNKKEYIQKQGKGNLKVALIYDSPNWAIHSQAKGFIKNKKSNIQYNAYSMKEFLSLNLEKYDIIFIMASFGMSRAICKNKLINRPFVTMVHHHPYSIGLENSEIEGNIWLQKEIQFIKNSLRHCTISEYIKQAWKERCNVDAYYLPSGIDTNTFKFHDILKHDTITIGWVGNKNKKLKGYYDIIIPAINIVKRKYPNVVFKTHGYENLISHEKMPEFYSDIDLYICASSHEGLPTPLVETCACGIPFVSTAVGVTSEININNLNYIVNRDTYSLSNGIIKMINDPKRMKSAGILNRQIIMAGWSWDIIAEIWEQFVLGDMKKFHQTHIKRTQQINNIQK